MSGKNPEISKSLLSSTKSNLPIMGKAQAPQVGRIAQAFLNVDLRNSHDGLLAIAKKRGININEFPAGNFLVFINETANRFKLMTPARHTNDGYVLDWVICYYKSPHGRITPDLLYNLPKLFTPTGHLSIAKDGRALLDERLRMKRIRSVN